MKPSSLLEELKSGVHVHTKITKGNKRHVNAISRRTGLNKNIIFNDALARGLKSMVPKAKK